MSKHKNRNKHLLPSGGQSPPLQRQQITAASYRGPLPHPEMLKQYETVVPGMAERLLRSFEEQGVHRRKMDGESLVYNYRLAHRGQTFAFVMGMSALISGAYLVATGHSPEGIAVVFGSIASLVGAFLWSSRRPKPPAAPETPNA